MMDGLDAGTGWRPATLELVKQLLPSAPCDVHVAGESVHWCVCRKKWDEGGPCTEMECF